MLHCVEIFGVVGKLLMLSGDKICAPGCHELGPGCRQLIYLGGCAVVHVATDKDDVGMEPGEHGHDAADESGAVYVTEMSIADQRRYPSSPCLRQIGQFNGDSLYAPPGGIDDAVQTCQQGQAKKHGREPPPVRIQSEEPGPAIERPARAC